MHGFATLQQMVNQACHQAEDSTPYSLAALQAVHKLNRCDAIDTMWAVNDWNTLARVVCTPIKLFLVVQCTLTRDVSGEPLTDKEC